MAEYRTTFTTTTPIDVAFSYLSRFSSAVEWDPGVVEAEDRTPGPVRVGSEFALVTSFLGRRVPLTYEVVELQPPNRVELRAENRNLQSIDVIRLEENRDGSVAITYDARLSMRGLARLFEPVVAVAFRRIGDRAAEGLRSAMEELAPAALSQPEHDHR